MKTLAIDNGTFNTAGAVQLASGEVYTIQSSSGPSTQGKSTASFVEFDANGNVLSIGEMAKRNRAVKPKLVVWGTKRLVGLSYSKAKEEGELRHFEYPIEGDEQDRIVIRIGPKKFFPQDILGIIFKAVKEDAENPDANAALLGTRFDTAVVSYPAFYNAVRVGFIEAAAKGTPEAPLFRQVETVAEPTAAAIRYGLQIQQNAKVMAFDFGAGTLDVSIVRLTRRNGTLQPIERGVSGHEALGGMDLDRCLLDHLKAVPEFLKGREKLSDSVLLDLIETAKIQLSAFESTTIPGPTAYNLTRQELESAIGRLIERCRNPISTALTLAGMSAADLDHLVMVGGPTKMPMVRRIVAKELEKLGARQTVIDQALNPPPEIDPMECVAQGAAQMPADLERTMPEGFGVVLGNSYQNMIAPGSSFPAKSPAFPLGPLVKHGLRQAAVQVALKIPDANGRSGAFSFTSLGHYTVHLNPTISPNITVELEITPQKVLSINLTQTKCPTNKAVYSAANLLLRESLKVLAEDKEPTIPEEVLKMIADARLAELPNEEWTADQQQDLLALTRRLADRVSRLANGNGALSAKLREVKSAMQQMSSGSPNETAPRLANAMDETLHLLRVHNMLPLAEVESFELEFGAIKS